MADDPEHSSDGPSDTDSDSPDVDDDDDEEELEEEAPDYHIDVDEKYIVSYVQNKCVTCSCSNCYNSLTRHSSKSAASKM